MAKNSSLCKFFLLRNQKLASATRESLRQRLEKVGVLEVHQRKYTTSEKIPPR